MTVAELIELLAEMHRPGHTVDVRYDKADAAEADWAVTDAFPVDMPSGDGWVTLILGDWT
jgi:hypothetical protein